MEKGTRLLETEPPSSDLLLLLVLVEKHTVAVVVVVVFVGEFTLCWPCCCNRDHDEKREDWSLLSTLLDPAKAARERRLPVTDSALAATTTRRSIISENKHNRRPEDDLEMLIVTFYHGTKSECFVFNTSPIIIAPASIASHRIAALLA
jgi:hypothetical protein